MVEAEFLRLARGLRWYVVAGGASALIYSEGPDFKFHLFARILHPEGQTERGARRFAKEISRILERSFLAGRFSSLVLAAEPAFLAQLRKRLPPELRGIVEREIGRAYAGPEESLQEWLRAELEHDSGKALA